MITLDCVAPPRNSKISPFTKTTPGLVSEPLTVHPEIMVLSPTMLPNELKIEKWQVTRLLLATFF